MTSSTNEGNIMTFTTNTLVGQRTVVQGTDIHGTEGRTVLDSRQWEDIKAQKNYAKAQAEFDEATKAFYAPLTEAADKLEAATDQPQADPVTYFDLEPAVEATPGTPGRRVQLTHDSQVLRLLEQGSHNRLMWVGDNLEILEAPAPTQAGTIASAVDQQHTP